MQESCKQLGLMPNFYDISYYGKFDMFAIDLDGGVSISDICKGKTIVIINDSFVLSSSTLEVIKVNTLDLISKE